MSDLLKALGAAARDDRASSPETEDEAAAASGLDEASREAMVDAALAALALPLDAPSPDRPPSPLREVGPRDKAPVKAAPIAPPAGRRTVVARLARWQYNAAAVLAVAASVAFFLVFRSGGTSGDALPAYSLSLSGSVSEVRGEPVAQTATAKLRPESVLTLVLRPEAPVTRALEARAFVEQGGSLRRVDAPVEISPEGSLRLVARADRLFSPARGNHRLIVAVGARGALPEGASLEALRRAPGVHVAEAQISVEGP